MRLRQILSEIRHPNDAIDLSTYRSDNHDAERVLFDQGRKLGLKPNTIIKMLDLEGKKTVVRVPGYCIHWEEAVKQWATIGANGPCLATSYGCDLCVVMYNRPEALKPISQFTDDIVGWRGVPAHQYGEKELPRLMKRKNQSPKDVHSIVRSVVPGVYNDTMEAGFFTEMIINVPCRIVKVAEANLDSEEPASIYLTKQEEFKLSEPTTEPLYQIGDVLKFGWEVKRVRWTARGYVYSTQNQKTNAKTDFDEDEVTQFYRP